MPTTTGRATSFITFTRTSNATVTDSNGFIEWAGHNLLTNSESFDASAWSRSGMTGVTANSTAALNGTTTADTAVESNTLADHWLSQTASMPAGSAVTLAVYVKRGSGTRNLYLRCLAQGGSDLIAAYYNLGTGAVGSTVNGGTGTVSSTTITDVGSGWYLCTLTGVFSTGNALSSVAVGIANGTTNGSHYFTGDGTSSLILWGAHLYRSDLGSMVLNPARGDAYYPTTPPNLLGYTEDFSNAAWSKTAASVVSNSVIAPNGLQTADTIVEDTTNNVHRVFQGVTITLSPHTLSFYAKPAGRNWVYIYTGTGSQTAYVNIATGAVGTTSGAPTVTLTSAGNGWYRVSFGFTNAVSGAQNIQLMMASADGTNSYTGDGTSGIYLWGAQLSDSASLDAYSPVYGAAVTSAAYYAPRLDYDANGSALGLLVEEQRTNLATYSEAFDDAVWAGATAGIASRTANTTAAPTGTSVADTITANNALAAHYIGRSVTWTAAVHTVSVFLKYSTQQFVQLNTWDGTTARFANFDIQNGVAGTTSNATSTITSFGNGWYRCTMTGSAAQAAASGNWVICFANSNSASATPTYTTAGTEAFFVYGAQIEENASFATSYIPTGAATATRTADVASVSTQAFPYSASTQSLVVSYQTFENSNSGGVFSINNGGDTNRLDFRTSGSVVATASGANQLTGVDLTIGAAGTINKAGFALAVNDFADVANGGTVKTDTTVTLPATATIFNLGYLDNHPSAYRLNGHIRQITYIPRRLSNAELQARTL